MNSENVRAEAAFISEKIAKLINERLRAANARGEWGETVMAIYVALRTTSAFVLKMLSRAGKSEAEAINFARDVEKVTRGEVIGQ